MNAPLPFSDLPVPGFRPELNLLPHQVRGMERALQVGNFAEFSVQGAGKTMTVLATFAHWHDRGEVERLLVIGPVSSFQPWEDEITRCFMDELPVLRWSGSASARTRMVPAYRRSHIVLCSYDTARRDVHMLREQLRASPTALVLDESHYIKNFEIGARGAAALELAPYAAKRLILSGTPAPHSLLGSLRPVRIPMARGQGRADRHSTGIPYTTVSFLCSGRRIAENSRPIFPPAPHSQNWD